MIARQFEVSSMRNFSYLFGDEAAQVGAIIDPSAEPERLIAEAKEAGLTLTHVFNTHSHHDHIGGNEFLRRLGLKLVAHRSSPIRPDLAVEDGDSIRLGNIEVRVLYTPGHSPDSICLLAGEYLFTGDTLFVGDCGRVDLLGSSVADMHHSLLSVLRSLPDQLMVMPGHNYGPAPHRTLGEEKALNHTLQPRTMEQFVAFMAAP